MSKGDGPERNELQLQIQHALIEKLSASEKRSRGLLNMLQEIVFECDADGCFTFLNTAWKLLLGLPISSCIGRSIFDFVVDPSGKLTLRNLIDNVGPEAARIGNDSVELRVGATEMLARWFILRLRRQPNGFVGTMFDITERRRSEVLLKQQALESRRLAFVASATDNIVIITDRDGAIEWVNRSFEEVTEYAAQEVIGRRPGDFLQGPRSDPAVITTMREAIGSGKEFNVEVINYSKSGRPYLVEIEVKPIFDDDGELTKFVAIESDITERRSAETALRENEGRYRHVVDNVSDVILRADSDGRITFLSPAWERMTRLDVAECIGKHAINFVHRADRQAIAEHFESAAREGSTERRIECRIKDESGNPIWIEALIAPIVAEEDGDAAVGFVGTLSNIEERRATSEALREAKAAAEEMAEQKSRFLANMSHEIRTPLNAVIGMSELLHQAGLNNEQREFVRIIQQSGSALLELVNDVLHFSRFESGNVALESARFSIGQTFESAVDIVAPQLHDKPVSIVMDVDPKVPDQVIGDQARLRQVVINLLGNAAKFTARGRIVLAVGGQPVGDNSFVLQVAIRDTGPGIPENRHASLFDAFTQSDSSTTRRFGGSGLGLSICKQICELTGGSITVRSKPGKGSTFSFSFPVTLSDQEHSSCEIMDGVSLSACVLGNDGVLSQAVTRALGRCDISVCNLSDIGSGSAADDSENLLLIASGAEWAERARAISAGLHTEDRRVFLVVIENAAVSAQPIVRDKDAIYVRGPFKPWAFQEACRRYLAPVILSNIMVEHTLSEVTASPLSILVAEDNLANQMVMRGLLEGLGHQVQIVENGLLACRAAAGGHFDLVFMDLQMPIMDGFRATREIRNNVAIDSLLPVIAVTADAMDGDRELCLDAGMNNYITKPVTQRNLSRVIEHALDSRTDPSIEQSITGPIATGTFTHELGVIGYAHLSKLLQSYQSAQRRRAQDECGQLSEDINLCLTLLDERFPHLGINAGSIKLPADVDAVRQTLQALRATA